MTKMSDKHSLTFKDDPIKDKRAMIESMKTFKNSSYPKNPFKDSSPRTASDPSYSPHTAKVKR